MSQAIKRLLALSIIIFTVFVSFIFSSNLATAADYRNAYMIAWDGTACDNIDYAKSMGYDYVMYQSGMENCANSNNLYFYIESPDQKLQIRRDYIYFDETYSEAEKIEYGNFLLWKSEDAFPNNIATGWFFTSNYFRPLVDFQQQKNIDLMVSRAIDIAKSKEDKSKNFLFGGWSWDVPSLKGDLWSGVQNLPLMNKVGTGKQVDISYWTGTCSGLLHSGITHEYSCYTEGKAAYYKKLFSETKKSYPNMKIYMEPYTPWYSYMEEIASRPDVAQLKPDFLCEEKGALDFVTDSRIFASGLMTKDKVCSDTPDVYDHEGNLKIAGNAAVNGAWFLWYGRIGGTGNFEPLNSIREVPDRLKLIRAMTSWDNVNSVPLSSRKWDATKMEYTSTLSKANKNIIYSVHPKNKKTYFVILNAAEGMPLNGKAVDTIYKVDSLFRPTTTSAIADFTQTNGVLYLKSTANVGKGYIMTLKATTPTPTITTTCTDSDKGTDMTATLFSKGTVTGINSSNKTYTFTDACTTTTTVREYYCQNNIYKSGLYNCTNGCLNGACKTTPTTPTIVTTCTDSDKGNNITLKGTVTGINSSNKTYTFTDACATTTSVREYYCQNNIYKSGIYNCTNGCSDGACKTTPTKVNTTTCTDTDNGNNVLLRGTVSGKRTTGLTYTYTDTCATTTILKEYYCQNNYYKESNQTCTNGCLNGACKTAPNATNTTPPKITTTCKDSDNGNNLAIRGTVTGINSTNKTYTFTDACTTTTTVREYYCQNNIYKSGLYNCTNGCLNGACKTTPAPTNTTPATPPPSSSGGGSSSKKTSSGGGGGGSISTCGDSKCSVSENCTTCSTDCGTCPITEYCGDSVCTSTNENCTTCSTDCGTCPITDYSLQSQESDAQTELPLSSTANYLEQFNNQQTVPSENIAEKENKLTGLATDNVVKSNANNKGSAILLISIVLIIVGALVFIIHKKAENQTGIFPAHIITFADLVSNYPDHAKDLKLYVQKAKILGYAEHLIRQSLLEQGWPESIIDQIINGKPQAQ